VSNAAYQNRKEAPEDVSDEEFDRTLGEAINEIYEASTDKVPA